MNNPDVTVIIPSFNRAHLIFKTIPSYLQEYVKEIIVVDDCSKDNTEEVVTQLIKIYPQIRYIRQPRNMRQPAAKNRGLEEVKTEWVYFGDDDSFLCPGAISYLMETALNNNADIVGARALYMKPGEELLSLEDAVSNYKYLYANNIKDIVDVETLTSSFNKIYSTPVEVPFCHACLLMKSEMAKRVKFDPKYTGNAYREETDFIVRCSKIGAKIFYDSRGIQINLPTTLATGGARGKSIWKYKLNCITNNWYFLRQNWSFLRRKYNIRMTAIEAQIRFASGYVTRPLIRFIKTGKAKG